MGSPTASWLAVQVRPNQVPQTARIGLGEGVVTTRKRTGGASSPWPDGSPARPAASLCICHRAGLGKPSSLAPWLDCEPCHCLPEAPTAPDTSTRLLNHPTESHRPGPRLSSLACCPADPAPAPSAAGPWAAPFIGIERGPSRSTGLTPCSNPKAGPHRWIRAKG